MAKGSRGVHDQVICPQPTQLVAEGRPPRPVTPTTNSSAAVVAELRALLLQPEYCFASVPKQRSPLLSLQRTKPVRPKLNPMVFDEKFMELDVSLSTSASHSEDSDSQASV